METNHTVERAPSYSIPNTLKTSIKSIYPIVTFAFSASLAIHIGERKTSTGSLWLLFQPETRRLLPDRTAQSRRFQPFVGAIPVGRPYVFKSFMRSPLRRQNQPPMFWGSLGLRTTSLTTTTLKYVLPFIRWQTLILNITSLSCHNSAQTSIPTRPSISYPLMVVSTTSSLSGQDFLQ
jgi:hypothetical protein